MERHVLQLGRISFPVEQDKASLHALISNATDFQLLWMINIQCKPTEVLIDKDTDYWRPKVYFESMTFPIRDWRKLEGQRFRSTLEDDDVPAVYIHSHEDMNQSEIHFESRQGIVFGVDWKFTWSGYDGQVQPDGRVRTDVSLTEITVWLDGVDDDVKAKKRLEKDLDLSLLTEPEVVLYPDIYPQFKFKPRPDC